MRCLAASSMAVPMPLSLAPPLACIDYYHVPPLHEVELMRAESPLVVAGAGVAIGTLGGLGDPAEKQNAVSHPRDVAGAALQR